MAKISFLKKRMVYPETFKPVPRSNNKFTYDGIVPTASWQDTVPTASWQDTVPSTTTEENADNDDYVLLAPFTNETLAAAVVVHQSTSETSEEEEDHHHSTQELSADSVEEEIFDEISTVINQIDCDTNDGLVMRSWTRRKIQEYLQRKAKHRQCRNSVGTTSTVSSYNEGNINSLTPVHDAWLTPNNGSDRRQGNCLCRCWSRFTGALFFDVIDPHGKCHVAWLFIVTLCFMYNCWVIPLRSTFPYQTPDNIVIWMSLDYTADFIYLVDLIMIKPRLSYIQDGFWVRSTALTRRNYFEKYQFKFDICSLIPTDLFYLLLGTDFLLLRLPRMLKFQTFWQCYDQLDKMLPSAFVVRLARTLTYMLYLIHLNACAYYAFSKYSGLGKNGWVFSGKGSPYIRCFYFATKTATSIGKNPKPETEPESLFMTCSWLMGVFVFAILIGQMRDIIVTANHTRSEYRLLMDVTGAYMRRLNIPSELQGRIKKWFTFTWEQQHTLDERRILNALPLKMRTDICINVHIKTLSKVQLFHDCDEALLRELVLKLRPVMYLPGDFICRKGEVGKEMYIVKSGEVDVTGDHEHDILATLGEGSVFGEISLLSLTGGNRRTADVRSRGYSGLFVLSKADLNEAIKNFPEAQEILKKKAKIPKSLKCEVQNTDSSCLMKENAEREQQQKRKRELEELCAYAKDNETNVDEVSEITEVQIVRERKMVTTHNSTQHGLVKLSWSEDNSWVYGTSVKRKRSKKKRRPNDEQPTPVISPVSLMSATSMMSPTPVTKQNPSINPTSAVSPILGKNTTSATSPVLQKNLSPISSPVHSENMSPITSPALENNLTPTTSPILGQNHTPQSSPILGKNLSPITSPILGNNLSPITSPVVMNNPIENGSPIRKKNTTAVASPDGVKNPALNSSPAVNNKQAELNSPTLGNNVSPTLRKILNIALGNNSLPSTSATSRKSPLRKSPLSIRSSTMINIPSLNASPTDSLTPITSPTLTESITAITSPTLVPSLNSDTNSFPTVNPTPANSPKELIKRFSLFSFMSNKSDTRMHHSAPLENYLNECNDFKINIQRSMSQ